MLYVFAIFIPPLAVLLCGKPIKALLNCLLWFCFWIPGSIHAWVVVSGHRAESRDDKMLKGIATAVGTAAAAAQPPPQKNSGESE